MGIYLSRRTSARTVLETAKTATGFMDPADAVGGGPSGDALLLENNDYVLLETGDFLLLE